MDRAIRFCTLVLGVSSAAYCFGWSDGFHLASLAALLGLWFALLFLWARRRNRDMDSADQPDPVAVSPVRSLLLGTVAAAVCVAYLAAGLGVLRQVPGLHAGYYDRDRAAILREIDTLEHGRAFEPAADVIRDRLEQPLSPQFRAALAERLHRCLMNQARQASSSAERLALLQDANTTAARYSLDATSSELLLREAERDAHFEQTVAALRNDQRWSDLVSLLEATIRQDHDVRSAFPLVQWLYQARIDWGDHLQDDQARGQQYEAAIELAKTNRLDYGDAMSRLELLQQNAELAAELDADRQRRLRELEEERNRPAELPAGASVGFANVVTEHYPPALIVEVYVEVNDMLIRGLEAKDFQVSFGGRSTPFDLAASHQNPAPLHVVVAIDTSGSMQGPALEAARQGARVFLAGLEGTQAHVSVLSFDKQVRQMVDWTNELDQAAASLAGLTAQDATALLQAVGQGVQQLAVRTGDRRLVVFTDGQDNVGGVSLDDVVAAARRTNVVVDAIGLRTGELDARSLEYLADQTGGQYLEARGPEDLVPVYRRLSRRLARTAYRLAIRPASSEDVPAGTPIPLTIQVGQSRLSATTTVTLPESG